jgi:tetratricopeptide (TPR) repeat protein/transcriptional regulator with XRE-family HTH domain
MRKTISRFRSPRYGLIRERQSRGLSQIEVAQEIGTNNVNVSRWERGETDPGPYYQKKLCDLFGKTAQELDFFPEGEEERSAYDDPAIPHVLAHTFVGREHLMQELKRSLQPGKTCALYGLPGIGKTTLAVALATEKDIRTLYGDGVLWACLGPHPRTLELLRYWGGLLGISTFEQYASENAWAEALYCAIGTRRMLLVIDDAWDIDQALVLKIAGPNCACLLTTRFPDLAIQFAGDGAKLVEELSEEESIGLLEHLAGSLPQDAETVNDIKKLVQSVGSLPLAITLFGKYLYLQTRRGQPRRVKQALRDLLIAHTRLLLATPVSPLERPRWLSENSLSLHAAIEVSEQQLGLQARLTLHALSIFLAKPNSFSEEAALAVTGCSEKELDVLYEAGLLESRGNGRYSLHQTIADYARLKRSDERLFIEVAKRFLQYYVHFLQQHRVEYELIEKESENIRTALEVGYAMQHVLFVQAVRAFVPFLLIWDRYDLSEQYLHCALEMTSMTEQAAIFHLLGQTALKKGLYAQAEELLQKGLSLARQGEHREVVSAVLADLGWITWKQGEYLPAKAYLQEGLALARELGKEEDVCKDLRVLAAVFCSLGQFQEGRAAVEEALVVARNMESREQWCVLLIDMGVRLLMSGDDEQAERYLREGLLIAQQMGHREWQSAAYLNLADLCLFQKQYEQAKGYSQKGLELARQIQHQEWVCGHLANLGIVAREQGAYEEAEWNLQEALTLARRFARPFLIACILYECATLLALRSRLGEAKERLAEMKAMIPFGNTYLTALWTFGVARLAAAQGEREQAKMLASQSRNAFNERGSRYRMVVDLWLKEAHIEHEEAGELY